MELEDHIYNANNPSTGPVPVDTLYHHNILANSTRDPDVQNDPMEVMVATIEELCNRHCIEWATLGRSMIHRLDADRPADVKKIREKCIEFIENFLDQMNPEDNALSYTQLCAIKCNQWHNLIDD
jgi:hypothetical protein